jgi:hypothetical protein
MGFLKHIRIYAIIYARLLQVNWGAHSNGVFIIGVYKAHWCWGFDKDEFLAANGLKQFGLGPLFLIGW